MLLPAADRHTCVNVGFAIPVQAPGVRLAVTIGTPDTWVTLGSDSMKLQIPGSSESAEAGAWTPRTIDPANTAGRIARSNIPSTLAA